MSFNLTMVIFHKIITHKIKIIHFQWCGKWPILDLVIFWTPFWIAPYLVRILVRNRVSNNKTLNILSTLSISGYAIPGVILAIAFITFIAWFDENIINSLGFLSIKKLFIGSILGLVLVYFVRFYSFNIYLFKAFLYWDIKIWNLISL